MKIYERNDVSFIEKMNNLPLECFLMRRVMFVFLLLALAIISLLAASQSADAHSPTFPGNNTSLANATHVDNPAKSWAIYTHLEEGAFQYYALDLKAGDRLYLNLIVPTHEKGTGFQPDMAVLGPFTDRNGTIPASLEIPASYGWKEIGGTFPDKPTYESFSPGTFLNLATFDELVGTEGRYYVVVYQDASLAPLHGDYGLAVGYVESFTLTEFITIPFSLLNVYQWEGQSLVQIFAPIVAVFLVGLLSVFLWNRQEFARMGAAQGFALVSGLLFLSTASNTIIQTLISISQAGLVAEVLVTAIFIISPLLLSWFMIRIAIVQDVLIRRRRIEMFIIGLIGLFVWGGLIVGPILAMVGSVLPSKRR
jgi:hypothetical protein